MTKPYWWGHPVLFTGYLFAIPWGASLVRPDRDGLRSTSRRFTRVTWFIGHVNNSLQNRQDEPVSLKAPTAFAAYQRNVGIKFYKKLPGTPTNRVLAIVNGLICLVNRTRGHLYTSTGIPLAPISNKGWNLRRDHA